MKRVYVDLNPFKAHLVRTILQAHEIEAEVHNENLAPYGGGAEVWVAAEDVERALATLAEMEKTQDGQLSLAPDDDGALSLSTSDEDPTRSEPDDAIEGQANRAKIRRS